MVFNIMEMQNPTKKNSTGNEAPTAKASGLTAGVSEKSAQTTDIGLLFCTEFSETLLLPLPDGCGSDDGEKRPQL
ncbi:TPA: hypothetical protein MD351_004142 [Escherichia coli]|nr:hypothetical protein [Escherichia coli]HBA9842610.1 hypothetical protein [Escherichia coli]HBV6505763.1 hypothetical protein [Escherichia coli]